MQPAVRKNLFLAFLFFRCRYLSLQSCAPYKVCTHAETRINASRYSFCFFKIPNMCILSLAKSKETLVRFRANKSGLVDAWILRWEALSNLPQRRTAPEPLSPYQPPQKPRSFSTPGKSLEQNNKLRGAATAGPDVLSVIELALPSSSFFLASFYCICDI